MNGGITTTGRTRLRPVRIEYGDELSLVLQIEVLDPVDGSARWRDAMVEDVTEGRIVPTGLGGE